MGQSGGIVGPITDTVGLTDFAGQRRAEARATRAGEQGVEVAREGLAFQKELFADWQSIYGDIQKNLGDYYKNLGADRVISLGLQAQEQETARATREIEQAFAQRGLSGSGLEASTVARNISESAVQRSRIRSSGEEQVRQLQTNFLSLGLGQGAQRQQGVLSAFGQLGSTFGHQSQLATAQAIGLQKSNAGLIREGVGIASGFATGPSGGK